MVTPRLIHPVWVSVLPLDTAATTWDGNAREPVPELAREATVRVQCQVHWGRRLVGELAPGGAQLRSDGWLAFRRRDLEVVGWVPAEGDRVLTIDGTTYEALYLTGLGAQRGQYPSAGIANTLLRIEFEDRRQRRD